MLGRQLKSVLVLLYIYSANSGTEAFLNRLH
jgi:hypothetical protein